MTKYKYLQKQAEGILPRKVVPIAAGALGPYGGGIAGSLAADRADPLVSGAATTTATGLGNIVGAAGGAVAGAGVGATAGAIKALLEEREHARRNFLEQLFDPQPGPDSVAEQALAGALKGIGPGTLVGSIAGGAYGAHKMHSRAEETSAPRQRHRG